MSHPPVALSVPCDTTVPLIETLKVEGLTNSSRRDTRPAAVDTSNSGQVAESVSTKTCPDREPSDLTP